MTTSDWAAPERGATGDPTAPPTDSAATPGGFAAGAQIYRRLERRQRQPQRLMSVMLVLIAVTLTVGVAVLKETSGADAGPSALAAADAQR